ncbi:MAG: hypothetical protein ABJB76_11260 [Candidatus Nitrosocosmicus sp.]
MGGKTSLSVKVKVIREWIQGVFRDKIALNSDIAAGTVTNIIQQTKINSTDIVIIREISLQIKKRKS